MVEVVRPCCSLAASRRRLRLAGARHRSFLSAPPDVRETFDGLSSGWPLLGEQVPNYDDALYTFDEADLINWIAAANDGLDSIVNGHNPAMTELANFVPNVGAFNLPTAGWLCSVLITTMGRVGAIARKGSLSHFVHTQVREITGRGSLPSQMNVSAFFFTEGLSTALKLVRGVILAP